MNGQVDESGERILQHYYTYSLHGLKCLINEH